MSQNKLTSLKRHSLAKKHNKSTNYKLLEKETQTWRLVPNFSISVEN